TGEDSESTYVSYLDSMDVEEVDLDDAREYPGYATIGALGEMFFVADGESPRLTRYEIEDGSLSEDGELSFSNHVDLSALYSNKFIDENKAYMDRENEGKVVWNPSELEIESDFSIDGEIDAERDGLNRIAGLRRGAVVRDDLVFQPYYWTDEDYYNFADTSDIAVIDTEDDSIVDVIETPCPGLDVGSMDEDGNIYFTAWVGTAAAPVIEGEDDTHSLCTVRIDAGETDIGDDSTMDLSEITDGREVVALRILEGDIAVAAVLDHERVNPDENTDDREISYANNWELWRFDLSEETGEKIENTGYIAGGYYAFKLDGRFFVALANADYTETTIYEIEADGPAEKLFDVEGWVYQMVELEE
ncbi:MAG: MxcI, partial [Persicimonas sp.]